jgi:hypothetical protein
MEALVAAGSFVSASVRAAGRSFASNKVGCAIVKNKHQNPSLIIDAREEEIIRGRSSQESGSHGRRVRPKNSRCPGALPFLRFGYPPLSTGKSDC